MKLSRAAGVLLTLLVTLTIVAGLLLFLPIEDLAKSALEWVDRSGAWAPVVLAAIYIPVVTLALPSAFLTLAAGFLLGVFRGTVTASIAGVLGATCAFLVGRYLAHDWVQRKVSKRATFEALDQAIENNGLKIVMLSRLSPLFPFNVLNYMLAMTKVRTRDYIIGTWLGMLPGTALFVYIGSSLNSLRQIARGDYEGGPESKLLLGIGLIATVAVTVVASRIAKKSFATSQTAVT